MVNTASGKQGAARASQAIAAELRRLIVTGEIVRGGFLEPTNALLDRFGVSRPTLREAFRLLENERLVSVSQGSRRGVHVLQPSSAAATRLGGQVLQERGATIGELYEAALGLEPFAARLLAERRDPDDVARLRAHLATLDQTVEEEATHGHSVALARFHHLVVELTRNRAMLLMADLIADAIERHQGREIADRYAFAATVAERQEFRLLGTRSIDRLIGLIEAGDADAAEAHWRAHVRNANAFWLKGVDPAMPIDVVR